MSVSESVTSNSFVSQKKGNIVSNMGNEKVMLNVEKGKYYNLGEVGGDIWELISQPIQIASVIDSLVSRYDVKPHDCKEQVISFLEVLLNEGLIDLRENS